MKKILVTIAVLSNLFACHQMLCWPYNVKSLATRIADVTGQYSGCKDDRVILQPGQEATIDAHGCLMTRLHVRERLPNGQDGAEGTHYTSSGQSTYRQFYIVGPVNGQLLAGRFASRN